MTLRSEIPSYINMYLILGVKYLIILDKSITKYGPNNPQNGGCMVSYSEYKYLKQECMWLVNF